MNIHHLSFAKIVLLNNHIAEIIVNDGVELNLEMVDELHHFLLTNLNHPFSLLVNKLNSYAYSHEAQIKLGTLPEFKSIAVVVYSRMTKLITEDLGNRKRKVNWNMEVFFKKPPALAWLVSTHK